MFRLLVFDVDGTLTSFDAPVSCDVSSSLKRFENLGIKIALSSGKHLPYIEKMTRVLGVKRPIIIAENGCAIVDVHDNKEIWLTERTTEIHEIRARILNKFPDSLWEQPNRVEFTFSPKEQTLQSEVMPYAKEVISHYCSKVHMYEGSGCIDILPTGVDKGTGLAEVKRLYGFKKEEIVAVGNGENDIPMFREAGLQLIVGTETTFPNAVRFDTIEEALCFVNKRINECMLSRDA